MDARPILVPTIEKFEREGSMKKLIDQILKFGVIGVLCTVIDFLVFSFLNYIVNVYYLIATFFGFTVSLIVNYILSMKYVFERKEDMDRRVEFITFAVLSVIGLGLNALILYGCVDGIYDHVPLLQTYMSRGTAEMAGKIIATGIVMVYNFVSRKLFLEKKS